MGVRVSDNLVAAEVLLLVEGEDDRLAIKALLSHYSPVLAATQASGVLGVDTLVGGSNLAYKLSSAREWMCTTHCLIDHDLSGKAAVQRAMDEDLLELSDLTYTSCLGMAELEIEDWYDASFCGTVLGALFGVPSTHARYTAVNRKWSGRMRDLFITHGKLGTMQLRCRRSNESLRRLLGTPRTPCMQRAGVLLTPSCRRWRPCSPSRPREHTPNPQESPQVAL
jgi:hypothetical protein